MQKKMLFGGMDIGGCYTSNFVLWIDFKTTEEFKFHGSGKRVENALEGVTLQIKKTLRERGG